MKKLYDKMLDVLPNVWGIVWVLAITLGSISVLIWIGKWFLTLVGVL